MLGSVPPWLDVKPSDFVHAAAMGAEAGLQVAKMRQAAETTNAEMQLRAFEHEQQMQMRAEEIQAQRERSNAELQARMSYNMANREMRQETEKTRTAQQDIQNKRMQADLEERMRHNTATEEISADKADAMVRGGEATIVTHPELPGVKFLRNPSGAEVRVSNAVRGPNVQLEASGKPKGYSGPLADPTIQSLMGTNAPAALAPPPPVQPHLLPSTPDNPNALRMGTPQGTLSIGDPTGGVAAPPSGIPDIGTPALSMPSMPTFTPAPKNKSDRKVGETYMLPKGGLHTWREGGWEPYTPPGHDETSVPDEEDTTPDETP